MRRREGAALGQILTQRLAEIAALAARAEARPAGGPRRSRRASPSRSRRCSAHPSRFDPDRLHQEAILIASKADIREELDRLASHVAQGERLIADGGAVGRRLDFLAQELNRESRGRRRRSRSLGRSAS